MMRHPLLATMLSLAVTSAMAQSDNGPMRMAQVDKGTVANPATVAKKKTDGVENVPAANKTVKGADKVGAPTVKGTAARTDVPAIKGREGAGVQKQAAMPGRVGLQAGEHPPGEQGGKGGGGPGQMKAARGVQKGEHPPGEQGGKGGGGPGQLKAGRGIQMGEHPPGEQGGKGGGPQGGGQLKGTTSVKSVQGSGEQSPGKGGGGPGQLKAGRGIQMGEHPPGEQGGKGGGPQGGGGQLNLNADGNAGAAAKAAVKGIK